MGLTRLSINRPLTVLMMILGLVVMGLLGYTRMQVDRMPRADIPYVTVLTVYPGASPDDVAEEVLQKIEDAVAGVSGIKEITSQANENYGVVVLEFQEGVDGNQAAIDVSREVDRIRGDLPDEAEDPTIIKADINATPIMQLVLSGPQGQDALYTLADDVLKPRLQAVAGVASVSIYGGRPQEIHIEPDPVKLAAYDLPLSTLEQVLAAENVTVPAGSLDRGAQKTALRAVGEFSDLDDIRSIVVAGRPNPLLDMLPATLLPSIPTGMDLDGLVYLRDVAQVSAGYADTSRLVRYNGQEAVLVSVVKTSDANAIQVADAVQAELELFKQNDLPPGASLDVVVDRTEFTRQSVQAVQEDLLLAVVITGVIMLLFLHSFTSSIIVMLSVPTSLIVTFLGMWAFGFSLNTMTLIALTLVIAIVVDDSIVVLENIERHLKMGKSPVQAALDGRGEIGLAAITITFVIVVVYLPVAFMSGIVGQFFLEYGITVATATLLSLLVSFTLTPMLSAFWLKEHGSAARPRRGLGKVLHLLGRPVGWVWARFIRLWEAAFTGLANLYAVVLRWVLKNFVTQMVAVVIAAAALVAGLYLAGTGIIASEFIPQEDDGQINITLELPAGTNLDATNRAAALVEKLIVQETPELARLVTNVGSTAGNVISAGSEKANSAVFTLKLVDKADRQRSTADIVEALRPVLQASVPDANITVELNNALGGSTATELRLIGPDHNRLIELARQAEDIIRGVPGVVDIRNTGAERSPETRIVIDRKRAADLGLYPGQVALALRTAVNGSTVGTFKLPDTGEEVDIVLRLPESARQDLPRIMQLPLGYLNGQRITLGQVARIEDTLAPGRIERLNRSPSLLIRFAASGRGQADVANDVEAALRSQLDLPPGYDLEFVGLTDIQRDAFSQLFWAMGLSVLLIYMLLVALYQSWLQPLAILFSLPVTIVGAFGGLLLTGNSINIMSLLGLVMLIGIVAKNAILLVDYTNILRQEHGYTDRKAALVEAGRVRLRPILMTVFAIVFALLPLLFGQGAGAEIRAPMAAVLIGGNISSTLLTLILVPVMYNFFEWLSAVSRQIYRRLAGIDDPLNPAPQPAR
ncbi:MAG: efflux RND transporter permease subunit [Chloroflexi bacterium]|nr:MAG: efflux RND transporter permease subunit [Chloroflexota bacterium]